MWVCCFINICVLFSVGLNSFLLWKWFDVGLVVFLGELMFKLLSLVKIFFVSFFVRVVLFIDMGGKVVKVMWCILGNEVNINGCFVDGGLSIFEWLIGNYVLNWLKLVGVIKG